MTKEQTIQKLKNHYRHIDSTLKPVIRIKSEWEDDNYFGFLSGVIEHGSSIDCKALDRILSIDNQKQELAKFIEEMYDFYILPFLELPILPISTLETKVQSATLMQLELRDVCCLFCWSSNMNQSTTIFSNTNTLPHPTQYSLFQQTGMSTPTPKHHLSNNLLLCSGCKDEFHALKYYIDIDLHLNRLLVKVVQGPDTTTWRQAQRKMIMSRSNNLQKLKHNADKKQIRECDGELCVWFSDREVDECTLPNHTALLFHRNACLIWNAAGGDFNYIDASSETSSTHDSSLSPIIDFQMEDIKWTNA